MEKKHVPYGPYEKYFKRPIDFCCGLAAVIVFSWLYVIVAILVRIKLGSPVLFTQERPGKDGTIFKMYKFRTMSNAVGENADSIRMAYFEVVYTLTAENIRAYQAKLNHAGLNFNFDAEK